MTQEEANKIFQPGQSINIQLIEGAKNFVPLSPTTIIAIVSTGIFVGLIVLLGAQCSLASVYELYDRVEIQTNPEVPMTNIC